jgi:hypothetical protein
MSGALKRWHKDSVSSKDPFGIRDAVSSLPMRNVAVSIASGQPGMCV